MITAKDILSHEPPASRFNLFDVVTVDTPDHRDTPGIVTQITYLCSQQRYHYAVEFGNGNMFMGYDSPYIIKGILVAGSCGEGKLHRLP